MAPLPEVYADLPAVAPETRERLDTDGFVVIPAVLADLDRLRRAFDGPALPGTVEVDVTPGTPEAGSWLRLATDPVGLAVAWHLLGEPFRIRVLRGRNPRTAIGPQALHTDGWPVVTLIWMLDDFGADNGGTRVVPGSHRLGPVPAIYTNPLAVHPDERDVTGAAGTVLIFDGRLWHRSPGNPGRGPRRSALVQAAAVDRETADSRSIARPPPISRS